MKPNLISQQAEILFQRDRKKNTSWIESFSVSLWETCHLWTLRGFRSTSAATVTVKPACFLFWGFFGLFSHFHATVLQLVFVTWTVKICVLVCKQLTSRLQPHEWAREALSWIQCPYDTVTCCQWQMVTWWRLAGHVHHFHDFSLACFIDSIMRN